MEIFEKRKYAEMKCMKFYLKLRIQNSILNKIICRNEVHEILFKIEFWILIGSWVLIRWYVLLGSWVPFFRYANYFPANIFLFKVNNRNTRKKCETCSKLTIKTPELDHWRRCVFIVNFGYISHLFLIFLLLTLIKQMLAGLS